MSNLLPENSRLELRQEYRARHVLAGSILAIGAAAFMFLSLLPSYVVFSTTLPKEAVMDARSQENKKDFAEITRAQALLQQFSGAFSSTSTVSNAIGMALAAKPKGVHIDEISFNVQAGDNIALGGYADNRESINAFRNALRGVTFFTGVNLPVGDLIGTQGGRFTVTLSGKF